MSGIKFYLIAGATGRQGGAVVNALLAHPRVKIQPDQIYAISRQAAGPGTQKLQERYKGIRIVAGDLNNPEAIFKQLNDNVIRQTGVFLAQALGPAELSDAKGFIDAAASRGVPYFVYSSVDRGGRELSDKDPSYCKTFSNKFYIEKHLKSVHSKFPNMDYTILRPTWFADNAWWGFPGQLCMTGWRENMKGKKMQVTVVKDVGRWAAETFIAPDAINVRNQALSIASDELSFEEIDQIFKRHTGKGVPVTYGFLARFIIWLVKDLNTLFSFTGERDYGADLLWLKQHVEPTTFEEWVKAEVLDGEKKTG